MEETDSAQAVVVVAIYIRYNPEVVVGEEVVMRRQELIILHRMAVLPQEGAKYMVRVPCIR